MDNLLFQSALSYQALLPYRYIFTLGHKGKALVMSLEFPADAYHHLAGFQYVGFAALQNRKEALGAILARKVTIGMFDAIGANLHDRWACICALRANIENNKVVFKYRGYQQPWSRIRAEYLMTTSGSLFFIDGERPVSVFTADNPRDYELGCPRYTTLQIERCNLLTGDADLIYRSPSYRA